MENNEISVILRANHFLIVVTFLYTSRKNVLQNSKTNDDQRGYKRMKHEIADRKNWSKVKLTYLYIHLT